MPTDPRAPISVVKTLESLRYTFSGLYWSLPGSPIQYMMWEDVLHAELNNSLTASTIDFVWSSDLAQLFAPANADWRVTNGLGVSAFLELLNNLPDINVSVNTATSPIEQLNHLHWLAKQKRMFDEPVKHITYAMVHDKSVAFATPLPKDTATRILSDLLESHLTTLRV